MPTAHVHVTGTVQGVCYRASCKEVAEGLKLAGYARNEADHSVSVIASGKTTHIERLIAWCHEGPPQAIVSDVSVTWTNDEPAYHGFGIY